MSGGGSQTTTNKTEYDPAYMAKVNQNYDRALSIADTPFQPYTGQKVAGFNPTQIQSQGILSGVAQDPRYGQINQDAMSQVQGVLGSIPSGQITPQSVSAQTYDPAQLAGTDLQPYMNPFQKGVIDASIAQNGYARDQQGVKDNAAATAAHAFGGTRQAVQAAETTAGYDRNNQQNIAALNSANFSQAREGALADIGARNQAGAFNAGQRQSAGIFNSGQDFNAQQNTFGNTLAALGLKMNAAGQLVSIGQADLQRAGIQGGILAGVGDQQQQQSQAENDAAYEEFMRQLQYPYQTQQLTNAALGAYPVQATTTGTTTTKGDALGGILGVIAGGAKIGSQIYSGGK